MPKVKISEYSSTANSNTDVASINIDEGCAPSGINNAIRAVMGHLKDFQAGTNADPFNGPVNGTVGATTPAAGAFTTLSASSTLSVTGAGSIQGLTVGRGAGSVATNTAVGASALAANTSGFENTSSGYQSLLSNTTGSFNSTYGVISLKLNTSGSYNNAFGDAALANNTTGSYNFAGGVQALYSNTTASNNTAVGYQSSYANTTGTANATFGGSSGASNTTGNNNTFIGNQAGQLNVTGSQSVFVGSVAGYNATGSSNVGIGYEAVRNASGSNNVGIGQSALVSNTTASNNTAVGYRAGYSNTTGTYNTILGTDASYDTTTGSYNTFIGYNAGGQVTTGSKNTVLGRYSGNQGGLDIRTASNYIVLSDGDGNPRAYWNGANSSFAGNIGVTQASTGGYSFASNAINNGSVYYHAQFVASGAGVAGSITSTSTTTSYLTSSDYRLKNSVTPMTGALAKVALLKPCTYKWNFNGSDGEGFIAHELAEVCPQAVIGEKDAVDADGNPEYQGIDVSFLVGTLTAAIQELKAEFDAYKATHP